MSAGKQSRDDRLQDPQLPILMLHSISTPWDGPSRQFFMRPRKFRALIQQLFDRGWQPIPLKKVPNKRIETKSVVITFDDGFEDFYTEVFPLLEEFPLKPTVFIVARMIGEWNRWDIAKPRRALMTSEQVREMRRHGVDIGSHSLSHRLLTTLTPVEIREEVFGSKHRLEDLLGEEITMFAYPFGDYNQRVTDLVAEAGYKLAVTTDEGLNREVHPLQLQRVNIADTDTSVEFSLKLSTGRDWRVELKRRVPQPIKRAVKLLTGIR